MSKTGWLILIALIVLGTGGFAVADTLTQQRIDRLADAVAFAEGFYVNNSRPQRNNNPGDLTRGLGFNVVGWDDIYAIFATINDGWGALKKQIELMLTNRSTIYNSDMSILDVARRYTTTDQMGWASNVASRLGVSIDTKISEV